MFKKKTKKKRAFAAGRDDSPASFNRYSKSRGSNCSDDVSQTESMERAAKYSRGRRRGGGRGQRAVRASITAGPPLARVDRSKPWGRNEEDS